MYGFMRERRWFLGLLLILAIAAGCVRLGIWQLARLHQAKEAQHLVSARLSQPIEPLTGVAASEAQDRRVQATGRYDTGNQILLEARSYKGQSGRHLLTPLVLDDGSAVIVDRGWIPEGTDPAAAAPPEGPAVVTGLLLPGEHRALLTKNQGMSASRMLVRIDLDAIGGSVPYRIYPLWLLLEKQQPAQTELPAAAPLPEPDEPPHLSYAIQWFLFATTALVGYAALMRREAKERQGDGEPEPGPGTVESAAPSV